jgi:hypothetical protein
MLTPFRSMMISLVVVQALMINSTMMTANVFFMAVLQQTG